MRGKGFEAGEGATIAALSGTILREPLWLKMHKQARPGLMVGEREGDGNEDSSHEEEPQEQATKRIFASTNHGIGT